MSELEGVRRALSPVLESSQRANLQRDGDRVWLDLDNTKTLRGIRIAACPGCDSCRGTTVRHLSFTAYTLEAKP